MVVEDAFRPPASVDERESGWRRLLITVRPLVGVPARYGDEMFANPHRLPLRAVCRLRLRCGFKPVPQAAEQRDGLVHVVVAHSSAGEIDLGDRPRRGNDERACSRGIDRKRWKREALDEALRVDRLEPGRYVGKCDRALVAGAVHQEATSLGRCGRWARQKSETFLRPGERDKRPLDRLTRDDWRSRTDR